MSVNIAQSMKRFENIAQSMKKNKYCTEHEEEQNAMMSSPRIWGILRGNCKKCNIMYKYRYNPWEKFLQSKNLIDPSWKKDKKKPEG